MKQPFVMNKIAESTELLELFTSTFIKYNT